ncbi:MAG: phosphatase domain-containing protein [Propionibacteriaceae bacterium]|nr:DUF2183 domain-containing protein [Micropruina sp.]HBX81358.1 ABC transporter ATP-binding protein [Propionibacteriaceae bacterium]HBY24274.1 ABC transporter ATP-binding protein [Propionibacteriaceae bacterium]
MSNKPFIAARAEEVIDRGMEGLRRRLGYQDSVMSYTGYGTPASARVLGRVVLIPGRPRNRLAKLTDDFARRRGFRNFFVAAAVREKVTITLGSQTVTVTSDRGGYVDVRLRNHGLPPGWHKAQLQTNGSPIIEAEVLIVDPAVDFGLICDIDDTVITTWLPRPFVAAWNSFVRDESNRQAVPGMARMLSTLLNEHPGAPIVYVSTGAWNTQGFLNRFLRRHAYPIGPLLLTDWGPTNTGWFRSGVAHKRDTLLQLAADFPNIQWVLVGDDGQHDPVIYTEFADLEPDRVRAIAIRNLSEQEQWLAHGTNVPVAVPEPEQAPDTPLVQAVDGRELLTLLQGALQETPDGDAV